MKKIGDVSNYDYDHDVVEAPDWATKYIQAGLEGVVIGSQWPNKARWQAQCARTAGLPVIGTYAEPDVDSAIQLCREFGGSEVWLVVEKGSIQDLSTLKVGVNKIAPIPGIRAMIYGNESDLVSFIGRDSAYFSQCGLVLANYGTNDPNNPRAPITDVDFCGWKKTARHQYSSNIVIAGRVRDHNYVTEQEELSVEDKARLDRLERIVAGWGFTDDDGADLQGEDAVQYIDVKERSLYKGLQITQQQLAEHTAATITAGHRDWA